MIDTGKSKGLLFAVSFITISSPGFVIIAAGKRLDIVSLLHIATEAFSNISHGLSFKVHHSVVKSSKNSFLLLINTFIFSLILFHRVYCLLNFSGKQFFKLEVGLISMSRRDSRVLVDVVESLLIGRIL